MTPRQYLNEFAKMIAHVEITDRAGTALSFNAEIVKVLKILRDVRDAKKKVMLVGNGAEASIASHFALDLWKTRGVRAATFSDPAQLTALANDCGAEFVFSVPLKVFGNVGDIVIALSCSGESPNVLQAAGAAKAAGYSLVTLTGCEPTNALRKMGDVNIYIPDSRYGIVESAHALIMHCVMDCFTLEDE